MTSPTIQDLTKVAETLSTATLIKGIEVLKAELERRTNG